MQTQRFLNKVVVVTGAAQGIGEGVALQAAREGAQLVLVDRSELLSDVLSAVQALGVPLHRMPSGAGHDAMKLHTILPQAMLFVRGQNAGISHNPLESTTSDDIQLAVDAFAHLLNQLATPAPD